MILRDDYMLLVEQKGMCCLIPTDLLYSSYSRPKKGRCNVMVYITLEVYTVQGLYHGRMLRRYVTALGQIVCDGRINIYDALFILPLLQ